MTAVKKLVETLHTINVKAKEEFCPDPAPIRRMQTESLKIRAWIGNLSNTKPSESLIQQSVKSFYQSLDVQNIKNARLVCWGASTHDSEKYALIEDDRRFTRLLEAVDSYRDSDPGGYRRCYRGLLSCYFGYDPENPDSTEKGKKNHEILRKYLQREISRLEIPGLTTHDWIKAILEHRNLLSEKPCERYGRGFLTGEQAELDISASIWVTRAILNARFSAAIECGDDEFSGYIPKLLEMIESGLYSVFRDKGIAMLLERYSTSNSPRENQQLMDFAIRHWKNPWLDESKSRWISVSAHTKKIVSEWLKKNLLEQFFEILSTDGIHNKRRVNFWSCYIKKTEKIYFALGRDAVNNNEPSMKLLKRKMEGRMTNIEDGISVSYNNAIIMKIESCFFVEFGSPGSPVYIYRKLPFDPEKQESITLPKLKDKGLAADILHHRNNSHGHSTWEKLFESQLETAFGIIPDQY